MDSIFNTFLMLLFMLLFFCFPNVILTSSFTSTRPLCHVDESLALLKFKQSLTINKSASSDPSAYNKTASWKLQVENISNCCSWDGVECENETGHVIGLELNSSFLFGSVNFTTLFTLVHLQRLNLSDNDFNYSHIPSEIGSLSRLTALDLSHSKFSGNIPREISKLSKLVSLRVSEYGGLFSSSALLKLENLALSSLLQNLTRLEELDLSAVDLSSKVPDILANLSSLETLILRDCNLYGEFPMSIFHLPKLRVLKVSDNQNLSGHLPEFDRKNHLEKLFLGSCNFSGSIPASVGNLSQLTYLNLESNSLSGQVPDILANLSSLEILILEGCNLYGEFPMSIFQLPKIRALKVSDNQNLSGRLPEFDRNNHLEVLSLSATRFSGKLPESIGNLGSLGVLDLGRCNFSGSIPASVGNLSQLIYVSMEYNSLSGQVPDLGSLPKLEFLSLSPKRVNAVYVDTLIWLRNLTKLTELFLEGIDLSGSILSAHKKQNHSALAGLVSNNTLPKFNTLYLGFCNLKGFPEFLRYQDELEQLGLKNNEIRGQIPMWFTNISKENLGVLDLSQNLLTGFDQKQVFLPWSNIALVYLNNNRLQGPIPIPPPSIITYLVNYNSFSGKISWELCNLSTLQILELSDNYLEGMIPPCLSNTSDSLSILKLGGNNLHGPIPQTFKEGNKLKLIDLSRNRLTGKVPRLLENCKSLRFLDLSNNLLEDVFPFWLGSLPVLQVMLLGSNKLHGDIGNPKSELDFPKLHICALSCNNFTGHLPGKYFHTWGGMKSPKSEEDEYMVETIEFISRGTIWLLILHYSMDFTNKGVNTNYAQIMNIFSAIDLSSNQFEGEIPEVIGDLQGLELLNFSNNGLIGKIPSSLGNLSNLESLDISGNKLSGKIPQQLVMLNFLAFLNVSNNNLAGPIPKGKQFDTFQSDSYEGNLGLCGDPLSRKCENLAVPMLRPPSLTLDEDDDDSDFPNGFDWMMIGLGVASGLIVGLVIGRFLCDRYLEWFVETFIWEKLKSKRQKRRRRN